MQDSSPSNTLANFLTKMHNNVIVTSLDRLSDLSIVPLSMFASNNSAIYSDLISDSSTANSVFTENNVETDSTRNIADVNPSVPMKKIMLGSEELTKFSFNGFISTIGTMENISAQSSKDWGILLPKTNWFVNNLGTGKLFAWRDSDTFHIRLDNVQTDYYGGEVPGTTTTIPRYPRVTIDFLYDYPTKKVYIKFFGSNLVNMTEPSTGWTFGIIQKTLDNTTDNKIIKFSAAELFASGQFNGKNLYKFTNKSYAACRAVGMDYYDMRYTLIGTAANYTFGNIGNNNVNANELKNTYGWSLTDLRSIGAVSNEKFSFSDLYTSVPKPGFGLADLIALEGVLGGFTRTDFMGALVTVSNLKNAGASIKYLKTAGYTPTDLLPPNGNFMLSDLASAEYTKTQLDSLSPQYTLRDFINAGFSALSLKTAGYTVSQLKEANVKLVDLVNAGFTSSDLKTAGYTAVDLYTIDSAKFNISALQNAGYGAKDLLSIPSITKPFVISLGTYNLAQLVAAGIGPADIIAAGLLVTKADLSAVGLSVNDLKAGGFDVFKLKSIGYVISDLQSEFSDSDLRIGGYSAQNLFSLGRSLKQLREAAYPLNDVKNLTPKPTTQNLVDAGFTLAELVNSGISKSDIATTDIQFLTYDGKNTTVTTSANTITFKSLANNGIKSRSFVFFKAPGADGSLDLRLTVSKTGQSTTASDKLFYHVGSSVDNIINTLTDTSSDEVTGSAGDLLLPNTYPTYWSTFNAIQAVDPTLTTGYPYNSTTTFVSRTLSINDIPASNYVGIMLDNSAGTSTGTITVTLNIDDLKPLIGADNYKHFRIAGYNVNNLKGSLVINSSLSAVASVITFVKNLKTGGYTVADLKAGGIPLVYILREYDNPNIMNELTFAGYSLTEITYALNKLRKDQVSNSNTEVKTITDVTKIKQVTQVTNVYDVLDVYKVIYSAVALPSTGAAGASAPTTVGEIRYDATIGTFKIASSATEWANHSLTIGRLYQFYTAAGAIAGGLETTVYKKASSTSDWSDYTLVNDGLYRLLTLHYGSFTSRTLVYKVVSTTTNGVTTKSLNAVTLPANNATGPFTLYYLAASSTNAAGASGVAGVCQIANGAVIFSTFTTVANALYNFIRADTVNTSFSTAVKNTAGLKLGSTTSAPWSDTPARYRVNSMYEVTGLDTAFTTLTTKYYTANNQISLPSTTTALVTNNYYGLSALDNQSTIVSTNISLRNASNDTTLGAQNFTNGSMYYYDTNGGYNDKFITGISAGSDFVTNGGINATPATVLTVGNYYNFKEASISTTLDLKYAYNAGAGPAGWYTYNYQPGVGPEMFVRYNAGVADTVITFDGSNWVNVTESNGRIGQIIMFNDAGVTADWYIAILTSVGWKTVKLNAAAMP